MSLRRIALAMICITALGLSHPASASDALRVMTFNVRVPIDHDANAWARRRDLLVRVIRQQHPDVLGTQELTEAQGEYIAAHLPGEYAWFGQGRECGTKGEHMGVFYRTDRLKVIRSGNFWLSDTPTVCGSKTWGQPLPRMVTWARFRLRGRHGETFYYFNTHFPYRDQDTGPRLRAAEEILRRIGKLPAHARVILTGDFNCAPTSPVHARLTGVLHDAWGQAVRRRRPGKDVPGFHRRAGPPHRLDPVTRLQGALRAHRHHARGQALSVRSFPGAGRVGASTLTG